MRTEVKNSLTITFEGDHVLVRADGDKDMEFAESLWSQVSSMCEKNNCFAVLGVARSSTPQEALDGYDHARLFRELGIDERYRIGWVELEPEAIDMAAFIETVLVNRGLPGRVFSSEADARKWLLNVGKA
jgi:hypothetical protein